MAKFFGRVMILLIVAILLGLAYLSSVGFPSFLKDFVVWQMERAGVSAQFTSIRLDLFRGVVATDAILADAKAADIPLAQIDQLELNWSWSRLLQKKNAIEAIRIANAVVSVPTPADQKGIEQFTARDAYATFVFEDDGSIYIDRLAGLYCGIRLIVSGRLVLRSAVDEPQDVPDETQQKFLFITKVVRELNQIVVTEHPELRLDFDVNLGRPLEGVASASLHGTNLSYRGLDIDQANLNIVMRDGAIEIHEFTTSLYGGEVNIGGRYDIAMGRFDLHFTSTTNPHAFADFLPPDGRSVLREIRIKKNPRVSFRYILSTETGGLPVFEGEVETGEIELRSVDFQSIRFKFWEQGTKLKLIDVAVTTREGQLTGEGKLDIESSDFEYTVDSTLDPTKLIPLMTPLMRQWVELCSFKTAPHISASVRGDFVHPDFFSYNAIVSTGPSSYRGVNFESASAKLQLRENQLDVESLHLTHETGKIDGRLVANFENDNLFFDLELSANPNMIAGVLGDEAVEMIASYRFGPEVNAHGIGKVDFTDDSKTAWTASVSNNNFSYWKFTADHAQADLIFTNNHLRISNFNADFYEGILKGDGLISIVSDQVDYKFVFSGTSWNVNKVFSAMYGEPSSVTGFLSGEAEIKGTGYDYDTLLGKGKLEISDGVLWEAPLFGIFSPILGKTKATQAKASFTIADQSVTTNDLEVRAGAFTGKAQGKLFFDGSLDFRVEAEFLNSWPGINILAKLIGEILEYKVGGTLSEPSYRPIRLPKELLPHSQ